MYGQNHEDDLIVAYLAQCERLGTVLVKKFLDIGAYHPTTFSNTRLLYERGYKGVFVEPSPSLWSALETAYDSDADCQILKVCVGDRDGSVTLYDSGGDACSSTLQDETSKWEGIGTKFAAVPSEMVTVATLMTRSRYKQFDFINIDTEGNCLSILEQIDPFAIGCRMICVEWNGKEEKEFKSYFNRHKMGELLRNGENLIYVR